MEDTKKQHERTVGLKQSNMGAIGVLEKKKKNQGRSKI